MRVRTCHARRVRVRLSVQPYNEALSLLDVLESALADPALDEFRAVAAWANFRGLDRLRGPILDFRRRSGHASLIVGIDEGGATAQGLRLALELFDQVHVFFTQDERTFHPKLYLVKGPEEARLFVGSNNLTPGGVFFNFEAGLELRIESSDREGRRLLEDVERYIAGLYADEDVCRPLAPILDHLLNEPSYRIRDESRPRRAPKPEAGDDAPEPRAPAEQPFGRSGREMRPIPPGSPPPQVDVAISSPEEPVEPTAPAPKAPEDAALATSVVKRWYRRLDATQAQHPPRADSNVTGNLKLSKAGHDRVDQKIYFRQSFFGDADWESEATPRGAHETAIVPFEVVVDGRVLGIIELQVSHAEYRIADQNNVPTWLHWGRQRLMPELRRTDYSGYYVSLERLADGRCRLTIGREPTGELVL